jgi:hypothetical protein
LWRFVGNGFHVRWECIFTVGHTGLDVVGEGLAAEGYFLGRNPETNESILYAKMLL